MDDKARNRIKVFLNQKEKIGELRDEDLEKMGELGSGNGGVVMKGLPLFTPSINGLSILCLLLSLSYSSSHSNQMDNG